MGRRVVAAKCLAEVMTIMLHDIATSSLASALTRFSLFLATIETWAPF